MRNINISSFPSILAFGDACFRSISFVWAFLHRFYFLVEKNSCSLTFLIRRGDPHSLSPHAGASKGRTLRIWLGKQPWQGSWFELARCVDINHDDYTLASYASRLEIVVNPVSKFEPGNWREITAMPRETRQTSRMCLSGTASQAQFSSSGSS